MRRLLFLLFVVCLLAGASMYVPAVRSRVRSLVRPEASAPITPLALAAPPTRAALPISTAIPSPAAPPTAMPPTLAATGSSLPSATPAPTNTPAPTVPPAPVIVNGRVYDAYFPAATKQKQAYQYSCEFDAAWVILETYGIHVNVDDLVPIIGVDRSIEPYIEETKNGFVVHGGDILHAYSGDYTHNFLARSTSTAMRKVFEHYGLNTTLVHDRAGVEAALRAGQLVWIKTTVDFKPWRPATWIMPDGTTHQTVLGNDHAVVVMGFNQESAVIRDVLGPTSTNWQRPYEYEVSWDTFMAAWGAQSFDGVAVAAPS
jgi:hypothetical protein